MTLPTLEQAQALESEEQPAIRLKFQSPMDDDGWIRGDAHEEYDGLFDEVPTGWEVEPLGIVDTRTESTRDSWGLSDGDATVVAVKHETGIEILVAIGTGLATTTITALTKSLWKRWRERRDETATPDNPKPPSSAHIEIPRANPDLPPITLFAPAPASDEEVERLLRLALAATSAEQ